MNLKDVQENGTNDRNLKNESSVTRNYEKLE